jgi:uncharacterized protein YodC (DUF2158 family)
MTEHISRFSDRLPEPIHKIGDVVMLASGGPAMTVNSVTQGAGEWNCECKWFEGCECRKEFFAAQALVKVDD